MSIKYKVPSFESNSVRNCFYWRFIGFIILRHLKCFVPTQRSMAVYIKSGLILSIQGKLSLCFSHKSRSFCGYLLFNSHFCVIPVYLLQVWGLFFGGRRCLLVLKARNEPWRFLWGLFVFQEVPLIFHPAYRLPSCVVAVSVLLLL